MFLGYCGAFKHETAMPRQSRGPPFALLIIPAKRAHLRCAVPGTAERREWCAKRSFEIVSKTSPKLPVFIAHKLRRIVLLQIRLCRCYKQEKPAITVLLL